MRLGQPAIAVTGGAGFIGSHVTATLVEAGHPVLVIDDLSTGRVANLASLGSGVELLENDVADPGVSRALRAFGVSVVCHLAAAIDVRASVADPAADALRNVVGTVAVLQAAVDAGVEKVVFASSGGSIYGSATAPPVAETAPVAPGVPVRGEQGGGRAVVCHVPATARTALDGPGDGQRLRPATGPGR